MSKCRPGQWPSMATRYYAFWVDVPPQQFSGTGVTVCASAERSRKQAGYSRPFTVLALVISNRVIVSAHPSHVETVHRALIEVEPSDYVGSLVTALEKAFGTPASCGNKYWFNGLPAGVTSEGARRLSEADYHLYRRFFEEQHGPGKADDGWLRDYFSHIVRLGYCFGAFVGDQLASVTDAPDIPYMSDKIVEPGINTLPRFRRRGLAKRVCAAMIKAILQDHRVPVWSCRCNNVGSAALAESLGYELFGNTVSVSLS